MNINLTFSLDETTYVYFQSQLQIIVSKLDEIITKETQIMAQIDDLKAQIALLQTNISNLAADSQAAFADLQAEVNALGAATPALAQAISDVSAVNSALQTIDAAAKTADPKNAPVISSALTLAAPLNAAVSYQIAASNTPKSFNAVGLPTGLAVDTVSGLISGTPTVAGVSSVTLSAVNASGTGVATLVITVA